MKNKALCFRKGNVEDLRKKISELLINEVEVNQYKIMAREYICKKYNWDNVVEETLILYQH